MDQHRLHAVGAEGVEVARQPEVGQQARPGRVDVLGAGLVAGEARLVEEEDATATLGQQRRRDAARRPAPDDDDLGIVFTGDRVIGAS